MATASAHTAYKSMAILNPEFDERNEQILQELPQVYYIAVRILERLPQQVELSDLVQAGVIGLIDAYRNFDNAKGAQFKTFAKFRIRGAILDSLRALDWGPRGLRKRAREIGEATTKLEGSLGRTPTKDEVADSMGTTIELLDIATTQLNALNVVGQQVSSSYDSEDVHDLIESAPSAWENPFEMYCKEEARVYLTKAIDELSEREQLILSLYYHEELTMKEISDVVGITLSRVSQVHSAALKKLKTSLAHLEPKGRTQSAKEMLN